MDTTSVHAEEGTLAHYCAESILRKAAGPLPDEVNDEMRRHGQAYADYVRNLGKGGMGWIETSLSLEHLYQDGHGTCDAIIFNKGVLHIIDYKYGAGLLVQAYENPQLLLYASAARNWFVGEIKLCLLYTSPSPRD